MDGNLRLDLRQVWCKGFISNISTKYRLPILKTLAIRYIPYLDDDIIYFFDLCMDEVEHLFLNNYVTDDVKKEKLEIEPYFDGIMLATQKVRTFKQFIANINFNHLGPKFSLD